MAKYIGDKGRLYVNITIGGVERNLIPIPGESYATEPLDDRWEADNIGADGIIQPSKPVKADKDAVVADSTPVVADSPTEAVEGEPV